MYFSSRPTPPLLWFAHYQFMCCLTPLSHISRLSHQPRPPGSAVCPHHAHCYAPVAKSLAPADWTLIAFQSSMPANGSQKTTSHRARGGSNAQGNPLADVTRSGPCFWVSLGLAIHVVFEFWFLCCCWFVFVFVFVFTALIFYATTVFP